MGIRGLNKLINQYAKNAFTEKTFSNLCGSKIAIDSEILIHKFKAHNNYSGINKNSHIHGFISNVFWHLKNGIIPIYIFDGAPSAAKRKNALTKRFSQKERIYNRIEELENIFLEQLKFKEEQLESKSVEDSVTPEMNNTLDELFKLKRRMESMTVTKNHKNECKYLLKLMGIPFVNANEDAEALCTALQHKKKVDYVYTEDTDALTYAAAQLNNEIPESGPIILKKGETPNTVIAIDLSVILREFGLTPNQFIDMCILSGCDFCSGIPRIGPMNSYTHIKKYQSIENFLKETNTDVPEGFTYQEARDIFTKDHSQEITKTLELGNLNVEDLKKYLIHERSLNPMPIISNYHTHMKYFKSKISQKTLDNFFVKN